MSLSLALGAMLIAAGPADAGPVRDVAISDSQIVLSFDQPVDRASSLVLSEPDRIAVDVEGAEPGAAMVGTGIVSQIRQGRPSPETLRLVFDLNRPARVTHSELSPDHLTLTLGIAARPGRAVPANPHSASPPHSRNSITIQLDPPSAALPRPQIFGRPDRPLVVIDAGHGGHDPGALAPDGSAREKDVTLALARTLRDELLRGGRVRVAMTRDDDHFIVIQERREIARALKADLFISIHADSAPSGEAAGATVYTLSEVASDSTAARLAARENKADIINGVDLGRENSDVSSILIDLAQRETMNASSKFAELVRRESNGGIPFRSDYHRMAGFAVLKAPDTPAILLEVGYITNPNDVSRITSGAGRAQIAGALRRAIDIHFARQMASR